MAFAATAMAADFTSAAPSDAQLSPEMQAIFDKLSTGPVFKERCKFCHGNIAKTKNYSSEIIFSHGQHIKIECASCHPRFPHSSQGTEKPTMKMCFNCHGVRHGSMGILATDKCSDCHITPRERLRPAFHTPDWSGKPHVAPSLEKSADSSYTATNTRCMMCHTARQCDDCHRQRGIDWEPPGNNWSYNAEDGCQACHAQSTTIKASASGSQSFMVTGLESSAHTRLTCQDCHIDFSYRDVTSPSLLWDINAGMGCMRSDCHTGLKTNPAADYRKSVHYEKLVAFLGGDQQISVPSTDTPTVPATCASCHGGHYIQKLNTDFAKGMQHSASQRTCARVGCHTGKYASYNDYYHGAAYKKGSPDAPACWQCHSSHDIQPSNNPVSATSAKNLPKTCGGKNAVGFKCHVGDAEAFTENAGRLIHEKQDTAATNPVRAFFSKIFGRE